MRFVVVIAALVCFCEARPNRNLRAAIDARGIIGGSDASPGAWPWQLSQQRRSPAWSHSCGASLLSSTKVLSAAHCVEGNNYDSIRVVAGMHDRTDYTGTQVGNVANYVMHPNYNDGSSSFANDIAIIHLSNSISAGGNVQFATLPPNNVNGFAGDTCTITGWGRWNTGNQLPDILQQADIEVLTTNICQANLGLIGDVTDAHICVMDGNGVQGSCNGDSGGPLNCQLGGTYVVAGVTSWVVSNNGDCQTDYPSVYTRTGSYLSWIENN